ncbi:MAG: hypothetical protein JW860_11695, partial [Sedimentisphaerales bacterium]|nr:hypothetical protein [Sedimentisphaerales bacterium]
KKYIPQEYLTMLLRDSDNLMIHQRTRKTSAEAIKKAINNGQIIILDDVGKSGDRPFPFVYEHTLPEKEEEHYYRLIDVIQVAYDRGKLNEEKYNALKNIAHKTSGIDTENPALKLSQSILVDIHTLYSICQIDIEALGPIINTFKIHISKEDHEHNSRENIEIEAQEQLKLWNDHLHQLIQNSNEFIKVPHKSIPELKEDDIFFAPCLIAKEHSLSLLADDRVLQVYAINENNSLEHPSFGTDRLLLKLSEVGLINIDKLSNAFLTLMKWRYRFIVPTKDMLLCLAKRYKNHPPGQDLREVALYIHECMRDPGLFAGSENTTNKISMALRLYLSWTNQITRFLVDVWADKEFDENTSVTITNWTIMELMPSLPKNLIYKHLEISKNHSKAIFDLFLALSFEIEGRSRANKALQTLAECLNMSENDYFKAVAEVVDQYGK